MKIKFRVLFDVSHLEYFFPPEKVNIPAGSFYDRYAISRAGEKHQCRGQILPCLVSWSSTCHIGKGPEHNYPHDTETTLLVPLLSFFEASTLSLLAILFSLSHIATTRKKYSCSFVSIERKFADSWVVCDSAHSLLYFSVAATKSAGIFIFIFHLSLLPLSPSFPSFTL